MRERLQDRQGAEYYYFIGGWKLLKNIYMMFFDKKRLFRNKKRL